MQTIGEDIMVAYQIQPLYIMLIQHSSKVNGSMNILELLMRLGQVFLKVVYKMLFRLVRPILGQQMNIDQLVLIITSLLDYIIKRHQMEVIIFGLDVHMVMDLIYVISGFEDILHLQLVKYIKQTIFHFIFMDRVVEMVQFT